MVLHTIRFLINWYDLLEAQAISSEADEKGLISLLKLAGKSLSRPGLSAMGIGSAIL
jgi:hypothetical protein